MALRARVRCALACTPRDLVFVVVELSKSRFSLDSRYVARRRRNHSIVSDSWRKCTGFGTLLGGTTIVNVNAPDSLYLLDSSIDEMPMVHFFNSVVFGEMFLPVGWTVKSDLKVHPSK